jgi:LPXTG-motif cell wall-anchored protein
MRQRKTLAALGGIAALVAGIALAAPAAADVVVPPFDTEDGTGSITITKIDGTPQRPGTGLEDPAAGAMPEWEHPAVFEVWHFSGQIPAGALIPANAEAVAFDVNENAHWVWAAAQTPTNTPGAGWTMVGSATVGTVGEFNPDGDNVLVFEDLDFGFYMVIERSTGVDCGTWDVVADGPCPTIVPVAPFFVMLPMYIDGDFHTDVFVYPKNYEDVDVTVEKSYDGPAFIGDVITWTIDSVIPLAGAPAEVIVGVRVVDEFNACLTPNLDTVTAAIVTPDGTVLHTLATPAGFARTNTPTGTITVDINEDDHAASVTLLQGNAGAVLRVTIASLITEACAGQYVVNTSNTFWYRYGDDEDYEPDPIEPTDPPSIDFRGSLNIIKHDSAFPSADAVDEETGALAGASFNLFRNAADAASGTNPINPAPLVTGDNGRWAAALAGMPVGHPVYLVEVETPDGFIPLVAPIRVVISGTGGVAPIFDCGVDNALLVDGECLNETDWILREGTGIAPQLTLQAVANVSNDPDDGSFRLPMTGGAGIAMFTIIGIAGAAGLAALFTKKKQDA